MKEASFILIFLFRSSSSPATPDSEQPSGNGNAPSLPVPPGMSQYSFKRITHENPLKPEELEQVYPQLVT